MDTHNQFKETATFYDDINYPRGFSKHGDFTIREADALHYYGRALSDLSLGVATPETDDEKRFVEVCRGESEPTSYLEKLWMKYQNKIRSKHTFYGISTPVMRVSSMPETDYDPL